MLNSRGDTIHLFPAVPPDATVTFRGFQARGGFRVSASQTSSGVTEVVLDARRTLPCVIGDVWPGREIFVTRDSRPVPVKRAAGRVRFSAEAGSTYRIVPR